MTAGARRPPRQSLSCKTRQGLTQPVPSERTSSTTTRARTTRHTGSPRRLLKRQGATQDTPPSSTGQTGPTRSEGEQQDPRDPPFVLLISLSLSLSLIRPLPLAYKREGESPRGKDKTFTHSLEHSATRDLGALSLSRSFITPSANQCKNTGSLN
jgi:hypothetical protein